MSGPAHGAQPQPGLSRGIFGPETGAKEEAVAGKQGNGSSAAPADQLQLKAARANDATAQTSAGGQRFAPPRMTEDRKRVLLTSGIRKEVC